MPDDKCQRNELYDQLSQVASALASPARLKVIQLLAQAPFTVEEISEKIGESVANTSQHLRKLASVGLVQTHREGLFRRYEITSSRVLDLWETLQNLTSVVRPQFEVTRSQLVDPTNVAPITAREALALVSQKKAILIDARDPSESAVSAVRPALAIPAKEIVKGKVDFPKKQTIFVFCRGRMCTMADPAILKLREKGYKTFRLLESPYLLNEIWKTL